jgi:hypothetical protein
VGLGELSSGFSGHHDSLFAVKYTHAGVAMTIFNHAITILPFSVVVFKEKLPTNQ